jgi:SOS response regulatory protein OraA/RecX
MAKNSIIDTALANIDAQIEDLQRAKALILRADTSVRITANEPKAKRGRKLRQRGLSAAQETEA